MSLKHLAAGSEDVPLQDGKIRLYSMRFCPYSHRIHLVFNVKEIPHDIVYINLHSKPEWYLKGFPSGKVPSIYVDGKTIYESMVIANYLDEKYPQRPLLPEDPLRKAEDRILIEDFSPLHQLLVKYYFSQTTDPEELAPLQKKLEYYEKQLVNRGTIFFSGDQPGMVDYMIWPWFERFDLEKVVGGLEENFQNMLRWRKAMLEDSAVKKHSCTIEQYNNFFKLYKAGNLDYENLDA